MQVVINPMPDGTCRTIKHTYSFTAICNTTHKGTYGATMIAQRLQDNIPQNEKKQIYFVQDKKVKFIGKRGNEIEYPMDLDDGVYLIRKLSPRECFKLMGFSDSDYNKAERVNTKTRLYEQAGNSIVVDTLEAIFKSLGERYEEFST